MNRLRYPQPMILLHWLVAVLVIVAYVTGGNPVRHTVAGQIHVAAGMLIAGLFGVRLVVRWGYRRRLPRFPLAKWQAVMATWVQVLLYLCLVLIPFTGFIALSQLTDSYAIGGWAVPLIEVESLPALDDVHEFLGQCVIFLAGIHAVAGLLHHFWWRDGVLKSMSPH